MKAARLVGPKLFEFLETETPVANDGQVLIKLERVSVCGSDCRHGFNIHPEEEYPMDVGRPCHELAGTIVESRTMNTMKDSGLSPSPSGAKADWWST